MNLRLIILFLILFSSFYSLQGQSKLLRGSIIIDVEDESPSDVYITNLRTNRTTVTDLAGNFSIYAELGDTLHVSSALYETRDIRLTESLWSKEKIIIHLNINTILLSEALILSLNLTGYLEKDIKLVKDNYRIEKLYKELKVNPDAKPRQSTAPFSFTDILDVGRLYDIISGKQKKREALFKYEDREEVLIAIKDFYGEEFFVSDLKIPKEKIREFVLFSYESSNIPQFYKSKNDFKIMETLIAYSKIYLNRLNSNADYNKQSSEEKQKNADDKTEEG